MENVAECLENIDNNLTYYEISTQLACAYLKGHLTGWALDWFDVLGYKLVEDKATDYAYLKHALKVQFPVITPQAATPDQLWRRVETAWSAVPQEHIQSLFESMPRRVAEVISNNGGYSGY
ncbi:uncharacterized protein TNCV_566421 [Trichonephila clavipes]|nr:uncharacterized protein TNCV_566421 [Trichonephila clavipes]